MIGCITPNCSRESDIGLAHCYPCRNGQPPGKAAPAPVIAEAPKPVPPRPVCASRKCQAPLPSGAKGAYCNKRCYMVEFFARRKDKIPPATRARPVGTSKPPVIRQPATASTPSTIERQMQGAVKVLTELHAAMRLIPATAAVSIRVTVDRSGIVTLSVPAFESVKE